MAKAQYYYTQKILFKTRLPWGDWAKGQDYFWMQDVDGTQYLAKVDENGLPDLTI